MNVTWNVVATALLTASALAAAGFLSVALYNLIGTLRRINSLLDENREDLRKSIASLPDTLDKVNTAVTDISGITGKAEAIVGGIDKTLAGAAVGAKSTVSGIIEITRTVAEITAAISTLFPKRKKQQGEESTPKVDMSQE